MKKQKTEKFKTNKGITLIALVITIIVMLILVAVTISMAVNGGLFGYAKKASSEFQNERDKEQILGNGGVQIKGDQNYTSIDEYLETIAGIKNKSIAITSSNQEIKFINTITKQNILNEKGNYTTYEIKGISTNKDGEYITTGSVEGKSGTLEIVGDIKDTTFLYNLTNIMQGDEVFYCKVDIDGEEYFQEIRIIQGDVVFYEEDILTAEVRNNNTGELIIGDNSCTEIEGELWSGGKAKKLYSDGTTCSIFRFKFLGSKVKLIWGETEKCIGQIVYKAFDENGKKLWNNVKALDAEEAGRWDYVLVPLEGHSEVVSEISVQFTYSQLFDYWDMKYSSLVIDGIEIYK